MEGPLWAAVRGKSGRKRRGVDLVKLDPSLLFELIDQANQALPGHVGIGDAGRAGHLLQARQDVIRHHDGDPAASLFRFWSSVIAHVGIVGSVSKVSNNFMLSFSTFAAKVGKMSEKTSRNLGVRLDSITTSRLLALENSTGIDGVTVAREGLKAVLDYFEAHGQLIFPLQMMPKTAADGVLHRPKDEPEKPGKVRVKVSSADYALGKAKSEGKRPGPKPH